MDAELEQQDTEPQQGPRFPALVREQDATYPMLASAAAVPLGSDQDAFDEQILAGLVHI